MKKPKKEMHGLQGMTFGAMDAIINVIGIVIGLGVIGNKVAAPNLFDCGPKIVTAAV